MYEHIICIFKELEISMTLLPLVIGHDSDIYKKNILSLRAQDSSELP